MYKFYYWGPLLYQSKLSNNDINKLLSLCVKNKNNDFRKNLAGHIKEEYLIDTEKFSNIIFSYFKQFSEVFKEWYNKQLKTIETKKVWVNFMKAGEFNPPHVHEDCDFSCVFYLNVPDKLIKENKQYVGSVNNGGPGSISFKVMKSNSKYSNDFIHYFPNIGDFFIFPSHLEHFVYPFKSNCERVSVSANFNFIMK